MNSSFLKGQDASATPKQIDYIDQLAIDLNFDIHRRNAHICSILTERNLAWKDQSFSPADLSKVQASAVIDQFKQWKLEKGRILGE